MNIPQKTAGKWLLFGSLAAVVLTVMGYHEYQMRRRLHLAKQIVQSLREALNVSQTAARR